MDDGCSNSKPKRKKLRVGWREWIELSELDVPAIKAKIDTGARSSALHAFNLQRFERDGVAMVRFEVHPFQRSRRSTAMLEHPLLEERVVKSSSGHKTRRPVIVTPIELRGQRFDIELTLTNRDTMGFRMLIGRADLRGRFIVDPAKSYLNGKPAPPGTAPGTAPGGAPASVPGTAPRRPNISRVR